MTTVNRSRARIVVDVSALFALLYAFPASAQDLPNWVRESNQHARVLLDVMAGFAPEEAGRFGVDGLDEEVRDLSPGFIDRHVRALQRAHAELEARLAVAAEGPVRLDLQLLVQNAEDAIAGIRLDETHLLPYVDVARIIYDGIRSLLEDRIPAERRRAALTRLKRYAGRAEGYAPLAESAEWYLRREWDAPEERLPPYRGEIERSIGTSERFIDEIGSLFEQYGLEGYEADYRALREQVEGWRNLGRSPAALDRCAAVFDSSAVGRAVASLLLRACCGRNNLSGLMLYYPRRCPAVIVAPATSFEKCPGRRRPAA